VNGRLLFSTFMDKKYFIENYINAYVSFAKGRAGGLNEPGGSLAKKLASIKKYVIRQKRVPKDFYSQIGRTLAFGYKFKDENLINKSLDMITYFAELDFDVCKGRNYPDEFMSYLTSEPGLLVKTMTLAQKYETFLRDAVKREMIETVQVDPTVEYIEARKLHRHFFLHIGPTNSGKTYQSIQRLKMANKGAYLSPLRLLALEIYDNCTRDNVPCSMVTGEEIIDTPDARVISQTIETVDLEEEYDIAVIDEAQMVADEFRGHSWVKALMGLKCKEIHVCASQDAEGILKRIIEKCEDSWEVEYHERKTPLVMEEYFVPVADGNIKEHISHGDAFIVFSKRSVLDLAARFELEGISASVIYGNLPPEIRKNEVRKFVEGQTDVVISTDAIGMGINLPIRRIIFAETEKFDGKVKRNLTGTEVLQIAGRAGRFGIYEEGKVSATSPKGLKFIAEMISKKLPEINHARLDFPKVLLDLPDELDNILIMWSGLPDIFPYKKIDTREMLDLYKILKDRSDEFAQIPGGDDKRVLYSMISCPLDYKNPDIVDLWVRYCKEYAADITLKFPRVSDLDKPELEKWETYYRQLDLYHNFSLRMGKLIKEDKLREKKEYADEKIMAILDESKHGFVKRCRYCGKIMPMGAGSGICDSCFGWRRGRRRR